MGETLRQRSTLQAHTDDHSRSMTDATEIGTVVVERWSPPSEHHGPPKQARWAIERNRDLDIVRALPLDDSDPGDEESLLTLLDAAGDEAEDCADEAALRMRANSWCPASSSSEATVKSNTSRVTIVRSLDGVRHAEIYQNALSQYTMHQKRLVSLRLMGRCSVRAVNYQEAGHD